MPPPRQRRFRSIVCAIDFSRQSALGLRYAVAATAAAGGRVRAIHVVDPRRSAEAATAYARAALERDARRDLVRFVRETLGSTAAADCAVATGKPGPAVLAFARRCRASLVVVGTAGRRGASPLSFGSTTEAILRRFRGAVLAIPPRSGPPARGWPSGSLVAAIDGAAHRRARVTAAMRMAEVFGGWLSVAGQAKVGRRGSRPQLIILPIQRAPRVRMVRPVDAAYAFVRSAAAPVLVLRDGRDRRRQPAPARRAA